MARFRDSECERCDRSLPRPVKYSFDIEPVSPETDKVPASPAGSPAIMPNQRKHAQGSFYGRFAGYGALAAAGMGFNLLFGSFSAHALTKSGLGEFSLWMSLVAVGTFLLDPGLSAFLGRERAQGRISSVRCVDLLFRFAAKMYFSILAVLILAALAARSSERASVATVALVVAGVLLCQPYNFEWLSLAEGQEGRAGVQRALSGMLACSLGALLWCLDLKAPAMFLVARIGSLGVASMMVTRNLPNPFTHLFAGVERYAGIYRRAFPFARLQMLQVALTSVPVFVLGWLASAREVATYSVCLQFAGIVLVPSIIAHLSIVPMLAQKFQESKRQFRAAVGQYQLLLVVYLTVLLVVWFSFSEYAVRWLYSDKYLDKISEFTVATIGACGQVTQGFGNHVLLAMREERLVSRLYAVCVSIACVGALLSAHSAGSMGCIISYSAAMWLGAVLSVYFAWRNSSST